MMEYMQQLYLTWREQLAFAMVYIAEAHAQDEWPICSSRCSVDGQPVLLQQAKSTVERVAAAEQLRVDYGITMPLLVDPVEVRRVPVGHGKAAGGSMGVAAAGGGGGGVAGEEEVVLEQLCGPFDAAFAPWPVRFYVVDREGVLRYRADPQGCCYNPLEMEEWLQQQLATNQSAAQ
jgi:hypothetical protein